MCRVSVRHGPIMGHSKTTSHCSLKISGPFHCTPYCTLRLHTPSQRGNDEDAEIEKVVLRLSIIPDWVSCPGCVGPLTVLGCYMGRHVMPHKSHGLFITVYEGIMHTSASVIGGIYMYSGDPRKGYIPRMNVFMQEDYWCSSVSPWKLPRMRSFIEAKKMSGTAATIPGNLVRLE